MQLSVILPVYNAQNWISQCIESILQEKLVEYELIIVDDGSTDQSYKICLEYAKSDSRIKLLHKSNGGVSSARNYGLDNAKGTYVCFVDSDDAVSAGFFSSVFRSEYVKTADIIISGYMYDFKVPKLAFPETKEFSTQEFVKMMPEKYMTFIYNMPWAKFYKKSILDEHNLRFDMNLFLGEDLAFNLIYLKIAKRIVYFANTLYNYRVGDASSLTRKYHSSMYEMQVRILDHIKKYVNDAKETPEVSEFVLNRTIHAFLFCVYNACFHNKVDYNQIELTFGDMMFRDALKRSCGIKISAYERTVCFLARHDARKLVVMLYRVRRFAKLCRSIIKCKRVNLKA